MLTYSSYSIYAVTGSSNPALSHAVSSYLNIPVHQITSTFADNEITAQFPESIRGKDVFIINSICPPDVNKSLMEVLIMIDSAKRASAKRVTAMIPYFGYARQDRKSLARVPITAKLIVDLLIASGVDRVCTLELHSPQIQGFFPARHPLDLLYSCNIFATWVNERKDSFANLVIVSPDIGGVSRAREVAKLLDCSIALIDKRRPEPNVAEVMNVIGEVKDRCCVLLDDIVDTAGTLCKAAEALVNQGCDAVLALVCHPVLSELAPERVKNSSLTKLVVTNSIPVSQSVIERSGNKIEIVCCADRIAKAIEVIHYEASMSSNLEKHSI
ncbi:hypothetical protein P9112_012898 [Eukaryota sp. TZLM1-RC]